MQAARFEEAAAAVQRFLAGNPGHAEALYCLAVCRRYLGDPDGASMALDDLLESNPRFGRGWQERGHLAKACGDLPAAVSAYERAVRLNGALAASWSNLAELAPRTGRAGLGREAAAQCRQLDALPPELVSVRSLMNEDRVWKAERICRAFLRRHPKHVEGMRLLAALGVAQGILDDAEFLLESAVAFEPANRPARLDYINVLHKRQKFRQSLEQASVLLERAPRNPVNRLAFANQTMAVGDFEAAIAVYDDIAETHAGTRLVDEKFHLTRGHALKTTGRLDDAIAAYRTAVSIRADFGDAWWSLANLKTYRFTAAERTRLQSLADADETGRDDRIHMLFALGKALEDSADYDRSFHCYERGNRLRRRELRYRASDMTERLRAQAKVCTKSFFDRRKGGGCPAPDPIFIVGLPRAGSTLLEQILASHSAVDGTLELHHIGAYAQKLDGRRRRDEPPRYPAALKTLDRDALRGLGERYMEETRIHRQGRPYFVDKMPNNFRHVGLIHLILPNAKIIDARRQALACCFSNFKQLFASGQEFTYGLDDVGTYYRDYVALMAHWDRVLPGKVLRVDYEDVVADLEAEVRRILDYCGLPFEESCLSFFETRRSIRTPSSEQVRQPIYQEGLEQWRNYERHLDPLKRALAGVPQPDGQGGRRTASPNARSH